MKKMNLNFVVAILSVIMVAFVASCDPDDPKPETKSYVPVLGTDFAFTVDANTVNFTSTLAGTVWFRNISEAKDISVSGGVASTNIALKGEYPFTCNVIAEDGLTYTSDTFKVTIAQDDLSFLNEGIWKALTGGTPGYNKKWRLDDFTSAKGVNYSKYFKGSIGFIDPTTGTCNGVMKTNTQWGTYATDYPDWFDGVMDLPEDATISFNGATGTAKLDMVKGIKGSGASAEYWTEVVEGAFSLEIADTTGYTEVSISSVATNTGGTYSTQLAKVSFSSSLRFPLDMGVLLDNRFDESTLQSGFTILSCTDSAMVVYAWRQREWGNDSKWGHLFMFICDDYKYTYNDPDQVVAPERPVKTDGAFEVGTYKLADVPGFWVGWEPYVSKNDTWTTDGNKNEFLLNMVQWWSFGDPAAYLTADGKALNAEGQTIVDAAYAAYSSQTIEITATNIIVNYKNYDGLDTTYNTTYTVANGVVTFGEPISIYAISPSLNNVTEVYFLDNQFTSGILIGIDNVDATQQKYESTVINLIKQ